MTGGPSVQDPDEVFALERKQLLQCRLLLDWVTGKDQPFHVRPAAAQEHVLGAAQTDPRLRTASRAQQSSECRRWPEPPAVHGIESAWDISRSEPPQRVRHPARTLRPGLLRSGRPRSLDGTTGTSAEMRCCRWRSRWCRSIRHRLLRSRCRRVPWLRPHVNVQLLGTAQRRSVPSHGRPPRHDVLPPRLVSTPRAAIMPARSSGLVSRRTRITGSPRPAHSTAVAESNTTRPTAAPGDAFMPFASGACGACSSNRGSINCTDCSPLTRRNASSRSIRP